MTMKSENTAEENTLLEEAALAAPPAEPVVEAPAETDTLSQFEGQISAAELEFYKNDGFSDPVEDDNTQTQPVAEAPATPETPAAPAPVAGVPPVAPTLSPEMQQYVTQLEAGRRASMDAADQQALKDAIVEYSDILERDKGFTSEQATEFATRELFIRFQQFQDQMRQQEQIQAAFAIGQQYGIDPRSLLQLPSRAAMEEVAKGSQETAKTNARMAFLEAENKELKKKQIPATTFDAPPGVVVNPGSKLSLKQRYADGENLTPEQVASIFEN